MRLDKYLAEAALGTRKLMRKEIKEGKVTVNGQVIVEPATEIQEKIDEIRYLSKEVHYLGKKYYMFHKPGGCITATKDISSKTVLDYIDINHREGLFPVGRLDKDTEGLLLLTNDGEFSHRLMYPDQHVEKKYFFWVFGSLTSEAIERLKAGIKIGEEEELAKAVTIEVETEGTYEDLKERISSIIRKDMRINPYHQPVTSGYITITEGRKHQVKRMLKAVGCYVVYLKRVSIGTLVLDETLKAGQYRELAEEEIRNWE